MYPLDDNNLDRLSREAAQRFEVEPGVSGWEHLERRLDQELPQEKDRRRFLFWLFFITLISGGALFGILTSNRAATSLTNPVATISSPADATTHQPVTTPNGTDHTINNSSTAGTPASTSTTQTTDNRLLADNHALPITKQNAVPGAVDNDHSSKTGQIAKAGNNTTISNKHIAPANKKQQKRAVELAIDPPSLGISNNRNRGLINRAPQLPKYSNRKQPLQSTSNDAADQSLNTTNESGHLTHKTPATNDNSITQVPEVNKEKDQVPAITPNETSTGTTAIQKATAAPVTDSTAATATTQPVKKDKESKKIRNRQLELGLIAGPDASAVSFGPLYKPGFNFGLQVGLRLSDRWSVNTGVIYTKKFYKADSEYFHSKDPYLRYVNLEKVEGNCSMFELPLNVRYDVAYNNKRHWFVSTGLSTYLMTKENYTYYYTRSGSPGDNDINSDSNSKYIFSILNLSAGMERSLSKHLSLQAEPYLKIPLKGLGTGSMRMNSYGILFTLKYKLSLKNGGKR